MNHAKRYTEKFRDRANRSKRALLNEQKNYGFISDGSGKRYRVNVDYIISGDAEKSEEFIRWFEQEEFEGELFSSVRDKYIATYRELESERDVGARRRILDEWRRFLSDIRVNEL